jgi:hypothetical protein
MIDLNKVDLQRTNRDNYLIDEITTLLRWSHWHMGPWTATEAGRCGNGRTSARPPKVDTCLFTTFVYVKAIAAIIRIASPAVIYMQTAVSPITPARGTSAEDLISLDSLSKCQMVRQVWRSRKRPAEPTTGARRLAVCRVPEHCKGHLLPFTSPAAILGGHLTRRATRNFRIRTSELFAEMETATLHQGLVCH